ncbi:MAG: N-acetylglutaminylglutamine synthetase [Acetobacterales bacterium]
MAQRGRPRRHGDPRLTRRSGPSLNWEGVEGFQGEEVPANQALETGWGRLIFGQTFSDPQEVADELRREGTGRRDVAIYLRDPHVVLSKAPDELFLDPSHTYRLWLPQYRAGHRHVPGVQIVPARERGEIDEINRIYEAHGMVRLADEFELRPRERSLFYLVAREESSGHIVGVVMGADHRAAFGDVENGSSLWSLAVDPQAMQPGIGEALVRKVVERFITRGRSYLDLSVMHDNEQAIALYEKLGFQRVPVFAIKRRNIINEKLFIAPGPEAELNPYATIIIDEARRRGIRVQILDAEGGYFKLMFGGRSINCRESLTDLTTAVAMSRCADKAVCQRALAEAGIDVPAQRPAGTPEENARFLKEHVSLVVKPAGGEQGKGITVDVRDADSVEAAIRHAAEGGDRVLLEQFVEGEDLRIIVIDDKVVAAAVRKPAHVVGDGKTSVRDLIERQSRRREKATGGESRIPLDDQTERCVGDAGYAMDDVPEDGISIAVRKTANLHTGGTIHDVTDNLHPTLCAAAVKAARTLQMPVVGLDFLVPKIDGPDYVVIEANERPGLANHEPQPTAQRFIDLLFPQTASPLGG